MTIDQQALDEEISAAFQRRLRLNLCDANTLAALAIDIVSERFGCKPWEIDSVAAKPREVAGDVVERVAHALQAMPGWAHAFRLDNETADVARTAIATYLKAAAEDAETVERVGDAIRESVVPSFGSYKIQPEKSAQAALDALRKMVEA